MFRSFRFVKTVHAAFAVVSTAVLAGFLFEVISGRISWVSWIAVAMFITEGAILVVNRWRCPLTVYAERLGSPHGRVTDLFLPRWAADRAFQIYAGLFAGGCLMLAVRLLSS